MNEQIRVPGWAVSIIVLLIINMVALGFAAGQVTTRVETIDLRLTRIEERIFGR